MKLQILNNERIELKTILELIPILYAVFSCLSILYFVGYYSKFDALWLINDLSISTLIISTSYQMLGFLYGVILGIQKIYNQEYNHKKLTSISLLLSISAILLGGLTIFGIISLFNPIQIQAIIFLLLVCAGFLITYLIALSNKNNITFFRNIFLAQIFLFTGLIYFLCGMFHAYLTVEFDDSYQVNDSGYYMLEKQSDHIIVFRKNPATDKFEYKIIKNDDVISLSK